MSSYYVTTPIYYVNAAPHIGHSYTTIAADCLARFHRLKGEEVFFLTGTDEHGEKISQAASAKGIPVKDFTDQASGAFKKLWDFLGVSKSYSRFIRTTDEDHERTVKKALEALRPILKRGIYSFWYCLPCETSFGLSEIDSKSPSCLNCQRPIAQIEEEDYFLELEPHREWLKKVIETGEMKVLPVERRNEVLAMLENPLPDLCVTRPKERVSWGIEVPFSQNHVAYVWLDALLNYISALGWPSDARFERFWNKAGAVHLIGKDIIRHHAMYWPIILHAIGVKPPRVVFAHGFWKMGEQKMSKSRGNVIDPNFVVGDVLKGQPHATDIYRYFLLRDVPFGQDGSFSEDSLLVRHSADLANNLGNLLNRTCSMVNRYCNSRIPEVDIAGFDASSYGGVLNKKMRGLKDEIDEAMKEHQFSVALETVISLASEANRYIEQAAPWKLAKQPGSAKELNASLYVLAEALRLIAIALDPFMPSVSDSIWRQLGFDAEKSPKIFEDMSRIPSIPQGQAIIPAEVLFPKIETPLA